MVGLILLTFDVEAIAREISGLFDAVLIALRYGVEHALTSRDASEQCNL